VSGPGNLSQRTDGGPAQMVREIGGGAYGDRKDFSEIQSGAAMAPAPGVGGATPPDPSALGLVGFDAPSSLPDQPITYGADAGDGPSSEVMGFGGDLMQRSAQAAAAALPVYEQLANMPGASPAARQIVLRLKARARLG
jgi:hypothetical protein